MRPPEKDRPINILEGAVRSGKTHNNALTDLFNIVGTRNLQPNTGDINLCNSRWLVIGADEGSGRCIRGLTVGVAICDKISFMPRNLFQMAGQSHVATRSPALSTTNPNPQRSRRHFCQLICGESASIQSPQC